MMPVVLAAMNFIVVVMLIITAVYGWGQPSETDMISHMYWGVATSLFGLLSHTFTMFFFIGTSKAIRLACENDPTAQPFIALSKRYIRTIAGRTMLANAVLIVQPVLGAAVYSNRLPALWHYLMFWVTVAVCAWVFFEELKLLGQNNVLLDRVATWRPSGGGINVASTESASPKQD